MNYSQQILSIRQLMAQGYMTEAERLCKSLLQQQHDITEVWFLLAQIMAANGKSLDALQCIKHARHYDSGNPHYQIFNAHILLQLRQAEDAYQCLLPLMQQPQEQAVQQLFARASWQAGYFADAFTAFEAIARLEPIAEARVLPYARALAAFGRKQEIIAALENLAAAGLTAESAHLLLHTKLSSSDVEQLMTELNRYSRTFSDHAGLTQLKALLDCWYGDKPATKDAFAQHYQLASVTSVLQLRDPTTCLVGLPTDVLVQAASAVTVTGLWLEFGVFFGRSINILASLYSGDIHGFDSFQGLPEDWKAGEPKGSYSTGGRVPEVAQNVKLHQGWFDQTLPAFLQHCSEPVAFVHIDCDLYSSTQTVLTLLATRFVPGTVLVFDDFYGYDGFENHEFKAFFELVANMGLNYRMLSYAALSREVAFILL